MTVSEFETDLSGGHPNSLGNTVAIAQRVIDDPSLLDELVGTYASSDEVVRLRVSSVLKRVAVARPLEVLGRLGEIEDWVATIRQPSAQWSLAEIFRTLHPLLDAPQRQRSIAIMQSHLDNTSDWIVINQTIETLGQWAIDDPTLADWLVPRLIIWTSEPRKSIAGKARRHLGRLLALGSTRPE